jgi:hypothetical protein
MGCGVLRMPSKLRSEHAPKTIVKVRFQKVTSGYESARVGDLQVSRFRFPRKVDSVSYAGKGK